MADGRWRLPVDARTGVDPGYLKLLFAYEDRRFYSHAGVDPLALARAAFQLATRGHIVSGGSTITMQLARLMEPRRRAFGICQAAADRARARNRAAAGQGPDPRSVSGAGAVGGNLEGIRAASIAYFGKEPKRLSLAESALLVALPQSPETRRLDRYPRSRARRARPRARSHGRGGPRFEGGRCRRPRPRRCPACASRCRSWRRIRPTRRSRP